MRGRRTGDEQSIPLLPGKVYITPVGLQGAAWRSIPARRRWRLIGTVGEGTFCHKPCTVSGGGKSEISKTHRRLHASTARSSSPTSRRTSTLVAADLRPRLLRPLEAGPRAATTRRRPSRPILSPQRSLGSVIKLLTPSPRLHRRVQRLARVDPRAHLRAASSSSSGSTSPEWGDDWREHFSVDSINGAPGPRAEVRRPQARRHATCASGFVRDGGWRTFKLRQDFVAAGQGADGGRHHRVGRRARASQLPHLARRRAQTRSYKFVENCEYRLFQRPDDAIHRGLRQADRGGHGAAGQLPLQLRAADAGRGAATWSRTRSRVRRSSPPPMRRLLAAAADGGDGYVVCSANPRLVDGKPTKNPRYLQIRPDLADPRDRYVAEMRHAPVARRSRPTSRCSLPVDAVLVGRRNNPPDRRAGIRAAGRLQPDPLPGAARAVHGLHLLADRQEPVDDRRRLARAR